MPQRAGLSTGTGISTRLISEREDRLTTLYVTLSDAGGSVPSGTFLWAGLKFSISGAGGRPQKTMVCPTRSKPMCLDLKRVLGSGCWVVVFDPGLRAGRRVLRVGSRLVEREWPRIPRSEEHTSELQSLR